MAVRVQFLLPSVSPSGGVFCVLRHAEGLLRAGYDVRLATMKAPDPGIEGIMPKAVRDLPITVLGAGGLPPADIQVATHFTTVPPVAQAEGRVKVHFMQHLEEIFVVDEPNPAPTLEAVRYCFSLPLFRLANSSWLQARYRAVYGTTPVLVHNGVDPPDPGPLPPWVAGHPAVVSFVHGFLWKGTTEAFHAMELVRAALPDRDVQWHVFGTADRVPDRPWIHRHGTVPHDQLRALYASANAFLAASWAESYALPVLEAMAAGTVAVTQPIGTEDFARDGDTAMVVPSRDVTAAARAVERVVTASPADLLPLRERARAEAARHTWERATAQMVQALAYGLEQWRPPTPEAVTARVLEHLGLPAGTWR